MSILFIKLGIGAAAWLGCLAPYLASNRQKLLLRPLPRWLGWAAFVLLQLVAYAGLRLHYAPLTAGLLLLMLIMCAWPFMVIAAAHTGPRPALLSLTGVAMLGLFLGLGAP